MHQETKNPENEIYMPPKFNHVVASHGSQCKSFDDYKKLYNRSVYDNEGFWADMASHIHWFSPFTQVKHGNFTEGDIAWFLNGKTNVCYNCVDRHLTSYGDKVALVWEGDEPNDIKRITYNDLFKQVCQLSNALKRLGLKKGDTVCIYMPMVPETAVAMLACTRLGLVHSTVFAGFSAEAVRDRILDAGCKLVITADEGRRGGKSIPLKKTVDKALTECPNVTKVLVYRRTGGQIDFVEGRDVWWHEAVAVERPFCPVEWMDSEDPLFMLYTSGSTGKPKGILHTTGGYLVYAHVTAKYSFDLQPCDVYACMADVGWITGHSYIIYGPLSNGATTFMFESTPLYPDASRYWQCVERHKITILYTAPTAIRALMKFGSDPVKKYDRSTLRVLGSVGEPINPEAWRWYHDVVGNGKAQIVDTYWQTETGGHVITPMAGATPTKPGSATLPFFGIVPALLTPEGKLIEGNDVDGLLVFTTSWPGIARTIYGDHPRFLQTYMKPYPGYYFTGDGAHRDMDGYYWITGRVDDVINVSGHRIGSAEVESALVASAGVAEAAVVGVLHDIKGQSLFAYVTPKEGYEFTEDFVQSLKLSVRTHIGAFAVPDEILITQALPKTRSGKIMRRLLRKIACNETDSLGDISTLADEHVVKTLITEVRRMRARDAEEKSQ